MTFKKTVFTLIKTCMYQNVLIKCYGVISILYNVHAICIIKFKIYVKILIVQIQALPLFLFFPETNLYLERILISLLS